MPPEAVAYLRLADIPVAKWPLVLIAADLMRRAKPLAASNHSAVLPGVTTAEEVIDNLIGGWEAAHRLIRAAVTWRKREQMRRSDGCPVCLGRSRLTNPAHPGPLYCRTCQVSFQEAMYAAGEQLPEARAAYLTQQQRWCSVAYAASAIMAAADPCAEQRSVA